MNAVNLIPADSRRRRMAPSASWPTLALIGALLIVLVGGVVYVMASRQVKSRQAELAQVTASAESWRRVANSYQSFTQTAQQRSRQLADVRQLVVGRYPWEQLLSQIGGLMPSTAALTSLQATTSGSNSAPASGTGSATPSAGSTTPATGSAASGGSSTPSAAAARLPAVQLSGCAASQSSVAQTMVQLRHVQSVSGVTLASASEGGGSSTPPAGGSPAGGGSSAGGGCSFPVQFQMSLTFTPSGA